MKLLSHRALILLAAVAGMAVTASLGQWQLRRAAYKQAITDARATQAQLPPVDARAVLQAQAADGHDRLLYRSVSLQGRWLPDHMVYLENRQMHGRTGFYVVTPLQLAGTDAVVLVQRGWAPRQFNERTALPQIEHPAGDVTVFGHITPWPSRIYDFGALETGAMRQNLDFDAYRRQTGLALLPWSVQQGQEGGQAQGDGLLRDWPVLASGVDKHHGYAFQWFGLSALIALLYVWFQIVQPRRKSAPP